MMDGLLLFAHGARDPAWASPFEAVAAGIAAARPGVPLRLAYLEFMTPGLEAAAAELVKAGCCRIHVLPMFLGSGGHVRKDVPALMEKLRSLHGPQITWLLHEPIGDAELVTRAMTAVALNLLKP